MTGDNFIIAKIEKGSPNPVTLTGDVQSVYDVTERRKFKLTKVMITNISSEDRIHIYDGVSNASYEALDFIAPPLKTIILTEEDLVGVREFISGVMAYTTQSGASIIHVGGFEY